MLKEFRDFAIKGNLIDMAIGIIIGAAFGKVVASLVADVIMPPIGLLIGGVNFTDLVIVLKEASGENPAVTLNYGKFIQIAIDFLIVAWAIFLVVKGINALKRKEEKEPEPEPEPEPSKEEVLLTEIRNLLQEGKKE
ncbi:MAG TPA: large-conductance mechanosensitive channel protein MscL [Bacteroidales bacterium]|nr:large-conductance mechanosensitive channel protein MscL [Bacteroidales bacterium]HOR59748.1 large-conductance mechanosensitive channel protein MscL [Bacteroidales bacterium]HPL05600.1 large-conductance mechanosensitive channel protein MscL [Bacteroidales bacterium]